MPLITHLGLTQEANYFGHAAPFHCFKGEYKGHQVAIVTNGKDPKFGCDNVRRDIINLTRAHTGFTNSHTHTLHTHTKQVGTVPAALATYLAVEVSKHVGDPPMYSVAHITHLHTHTTQ